MIKNISVGIDMGSANTRVVVGEFIKGEKNPRIIGVGESGTRGMRHGYVLNQNTALHSLKKALHEAENTSGIKIKRAFLSISGVSLRGETESGIAVVSKANGEVTSLDVAKTLDDAENNLKLENRKVIQLFPTSFRLDGKEVLGRLEGMTGTKLEAKVLFITYSMQHLEDLLSVVAQAGVEAVDVVASPVAISSVVLSEKQKIVGVALVNIGAETVSLSVFENGLPVSMHSFPIGGADITNDIALGLKIPLETAEELKIGNQPPLPTGKTEEYSRKKLDEIIEARLSDIFELIENHFKKIKRSGLLPAGVIFAGGGANVKGLEEFSKETLKLPSALGKTEIFNNLKTKLRDPAWYTALSLLMYGKNSGGREGGTFDNLLRDIKSLISSGIKQLRP